MKYRYLFLALMVTAATFTSHAQDWKNYPYEPEGSLIKFPVDEGRHSSEPVEWWYTIGHLVGENTGTNYSYMLTYFYMNYPPYQGFRIFNVTNEDNGQFFSDVQPVTYATLAEDSLNLVVKTGFLGAGTETWRNKTDASGMIPFEYVINATSANGTLNLEYVSVKPPLILGDDGYFPQGQETYTYYYSQTKNNVSGTFTFNGTTEPVTGTSWIDRQYGTFNPSTGEKYEWFGLQLSNGMDLNTWDLFTNDNQIPDNALYRNISVYVDENTSYTNIDFNIERLGYRWNAAKDLCYAYKWRLTSDVNNMDLLITAPVANSEVMLPFQFYEGSVNIEGTVNGSAVTGKGYAELLHTYFDPEVLMDQAEENKWDKTIPISWRVLNPDQGRALYYDLSYSIDGQQTFTKIDSGLTDTSYIWTDAAIASGTACWFKVEAYSIDTTLRGDDVNNEAFIVQSSASINRLSSDKLDIYPNPAERIITFSINAEQIFDKYTIYDLSGKKVTESELQHDLNTIKINTLKPGMYHLVLTGKAAILSKTFIKK